MNRIKEIKLNPDKGTVTFKMEELSNYRVVRRYQFTVSERTLRQKLAGALIELPWDRVMK